VNLLAATQLAIDSAWAVYVVGAVLVLAGAGGVVLQTHPVHCALALVTTIFGIALLFIDQGADFLAAVQIIVYAGAVVILFLFVIMLLGVDRKEARTQGPHRPLVPIAIVAGIAAFVELLVLVRAHYWATGATARTEALNGAGENVQKLGQSVLSSYLLPFEMTSVLLVIAVVAAVVLVRRTSQQEAGPHRKAPAPTRQPTRVPGAGSSSLEGPAPEPPRRPGTPVR
jgi:NADH-quinone oxidoreductase subunit J